MATDEVIAQARTIAAHQLECAEDDLELVDGELRVRGTPSKAMTLQAVAFEAFTAHDLPEGAEPNLSAQVTYDPPNFVFPFGTHVAVVEVDEDTGEVELRDYVAVDDCGPQVNPMIVEGQLHGGLAQGIGQALAERTVYDEGQLLSASFMDYAVPRATDLPDFWSELDESQPCTHNPLGAKGCGESGAIGAPAAVMSALLDALAPLGVQDLEMPATPHRIWQAIMRK
jgi:aerobic carbon-monoxide dehydrogenase large subunit